MKIISLNTWGRAGKEELLTFFKNHKNDTDIFCLQEIWSASYEHLESMSVGGKAIEHSNILVHVLQEISTLLPEHIPYFRLHHLDNYGLLMLVHKKYNTLQEGGFFVHKHKGYIPLGDVGNHARNIQFVTLEHNTAPLTIINFHGLWNGKNKEDSNDRLVQSKNILAFTNALTNDFVFCGDFNLLPTTQSIHMLEDSGMRNLIVENNISSTRTSHYTKPEKFADYIFVTEGISVVDFKVLPDEISDHSPLYLEIA